MNTSQVIATAITAFLSGVVGLLFWSLQRKLADIESNNVQRHNEQVKVRVAERELLVAMAETVALTGRKVDHAAGVNGELLASVEKTQEKELELQKITTQFTVEHTT